MNMGIPLMDEVDEGRDSSLLYSNLSPKRMTKNRLPLPINNVDDKTQAVRPVIIFGIYPLFFLDFPSWKLG